jgi:hypothetical protein
VGPVWFQLSGLSVALHTCVGESMTRTLPLVFE